MNDIYGHTLKQPLAFYDPDTSSWKTYEATLDLDLEKCSATLPQSGMTQDELLYELVMLEPRTAESDYLSLPTPKVGGQGSNPSEYRRKTPGLAAVIMMNIPTPTAVNYDNDRNGIKGNHNLSLVSWARLSTHKRYRLHWIKVS